MIDHNHFICHFIFGGHLLNIPSFSSLHILTQEKAILARRMAFLYKKDSSLLNLSVCLKVRYLTNSSIVISLCDN